MVCFNAFSDCRAFCVNMDCMTYTLAYKRVMIQKFIAIPHFVIYKGISYMIRYSNRKEFQFHDLF